MDVAADWVCVEADRGEAGRGVRGLFPRQGTLGRPGQKRIIYPRAAHRWDLGRLSGVGLVDTALRHSWLAGWLPGSFIVIRHSALALVTWLII